MTEKRRISQLPFEGDDADSAQLWAALGELPLESPGNDVRRRFNQRLHGAPARTFGHRFRGLFAASGKIGWAAAAACLVVGLLAGRALDGTPTDDARLDALESNIATLQRSLVLDRLDNAEPGKRLRGVMDAAFLVQDDPQITEALLTRAAADRAPSIRSAAIGALAPQLSSPDVAEQLMKLLGEAESPLVQYALIDLVLRHGSEAQVAQMLEHAEKLKLHPELERYINESLGREST
jgi:hypothetical protein